MGIDHSPFLRVSRFFTEVHAPCPGEAQCCWGKVIPPLVPGAGPWLTSAYRHTESWSHHCARDDIMMETVQSNDPQTSWRLADRPTLSPTRCEGGNRWFWLLPVLRGTDLRIKPSIQKTARVPPSHNWVSSLLGNLPTSRLPLWEPLNPLCYWTWISNYLPHKESLLNLDLVPGMGVANQKPLKCWAAWRAVRTSFAQFWNWQFLLHCLWNS